MKSLKERKKSELSYLMEKLEKSRFILIAYVVYYEPYVSANCKDSCEKCFQNFFEFCALNSLVSFLHFNQMYLGFVCYTLCNMYTFQKVTSKETLFIILDNILS